MALDERPLVLTGPNGAGKTNLLEAVSMLAPGRGLRGARLSELLHRDGPAGDWPGDPPNWAVSLELETAEGTRQLGTRLDRSSEGRERRIVKIDGLARRGQACLGEVFKVVWLTPQMDGLFRGSAGDRRRFLDRLVAAYDAEQAGRVHAYDYALRERARLFREGMEDPAWLSSLEDAMARHGVALTVARRDLVERLSQAAALAIGPFPAAGLELDCTLGEWLNQEPALIVEDRFKEALARARKGDRDAGAAAVGPHRSDFVVTHRAKQSAAKLCSTGEQKALLISIVLAHARLLTLEHRAPPVLLLDEVVAHLDAERREALFTEILDLRAQAWMTGTERTAFAALGDSAQFRTFLDSRPVAEGQNFPDDVNRGSWS